MNTTRAEYIAEFKKTADELFAKSDYQSVLLAVSQYWADEAGDAVHSTVVASKRSHPVWPHMCSESTYDDNMQGTPGEACSSCGGDDISWLNWWDDNGEAVLAFEPWCHEAGSQEEPEYKNSLPCLIARRTPQGAEVSFVGTIARIDNLLYERERDDWGEDYDPDDIGDEPSQDLGAEDPAWGDKRALELLAQANDEAGRRVLADYLLEKDFARGELIVAGMNPASRERYDELLKDKFATWFHPLAQWSPVETAVFDRGLLVECTIRANELGRNVLQGAPVLRTVETLHVDRGWSVLAPTMRALKQLGPIDGDWVKDLVGAGPAWNIEKLHVIVNGDDEIEMLQRATNLPKLRELTLSGESLETAVAELASAPWWKQLERLTIVDRDVDGVGTWQKRHREIGVPWLAVQQAYTDPTDAVGWELAFGPNGGCEATLRGYASDATFGELRRMVGQTPFKPTLVASDHYDPRTSDLD
ncbi:MAG: hypothetical protein QM831_36455 [Kofleriaceae bacterium]